MTSSQRTHQVYSHNPRAGRHGAVMSKPGLASFIEAKDHRSGGDNCSYKSCKSPVKSSPPKN